MVAVVVGNMLGQYRARGRQQTERRQNGESRAHRGNAANGVNLSFTLLVLESQVVLAPSVLNESRQVVSREAAPDQVKRLPAESRNENVAPCPSVDSTRITPPWRRAIAWAMASPRPVPPC